MIALQRQYKRSDGIFSTLGQDDSLLGWTLEHAFDDGNGGWKPILPDGEWTCVRGAHRLHGMTEDFITFEITGIPGHWGVLFHWGNWNNDSDGCVLVGQDVYMGVVPWMVTNSRNAFAAFMKLMDGVNEFQLTVR